MAKKRMTKHDIMRIIQDAGREASFVGNVILCHHRRPWTRLRGLARLILDGHDVRAGQFDLDVLVVDGHRTEWWVDGTGTVVVFPRGQGVPAPTLGWSDRRKENAMRVVEEPKAAEVIEPSDLVKVEEINAVELFTGGGVNELIAKIQQAVRKHVPDISTDAGRKAVASLSRKVSSAKVLVDNLGKGQVAEWKAKAAKVDAGRKVWRDAMDALRDEAREPLTKWEAEQERLAEEARLAALKAQAEEEAYAEYALRERERIVREKEAELARIEEENRRKAEAERAERERVEREERIRREAEEKARRQAQEEAERKERERLAAEEAERKRLERLAANAKHRERIHREARESLVMLDFTPEQAAYLVEKIAAGEVNNVRMVY